MEFLLLVDSFPFIHSLFSSKFSSTHSFSLTWELHLLQLRIRTLLFLPSFLPFVLPVLLLWRILCISWWKLWFGGNLLPTIPPSLPREWETFLLRVLGQTHQLSELSKEELFSPFSFTVFETVLTFCKVICRAILTLQKIPKPLILCVPSACRV